MPYADPVKQKEYYQKNKIARKEYGKKYWQKNKKVLSEKKKIYCEKNKEHIAEIARIYYEKNREKRLQYSKQWAINNSERMRENHHKHYNQNKDTYKQQSKEWVKKVGYDYVNKLGRESHQKRRIKLLKLMGDKCKCCGETDRMYLHIDHVKNDGYIERKGKSKYYLTLSRYLENPNNYQLLCANCNLAKHMNNGKIYKPKKKRKVS